MSHRCLPRLWLSVLLLMAMACSHAGAPQPRGIPILIYHQVTDAKPEGATVISTARFKQQMQHLADQGYQTLSTDELVAVMTNRMPMPDKPVVLTFDDGWRSVLGIVPVLDQHRFKASFWVIPGYVAAGGEYMDWSDLNALVANSRYEVQSHSFTHPLSPGSLLGWMEGRVRGKGPADVRAELVLSKRVLEARLGRPVHYLAWPLGLYNDAMVELARQVSYKAVLTSDELPGNEVGGDIFRIRRMSVPGTCDLAVFAARLTAFAAQLPEFSRHRC